MHWVYALVEDNLLWFIFLFIEKWVFFLRHNNYCKKQKTYQNCGGKEKSAEYYIANEDALKENAKN